MDWQDRIVMNPKVLTGKPTIKGTRLAVEFVLELIAERWSHEQILKSYPQLTQEDIWAVLRYAAETVPIGASNSKLGKTLGGTP